MQFFQAKDYNRGGIVKSLLVYDEITKYKRYEIFTGSQWLNQDHLKHRTT